MGRSGGTGLAIRETTLFDALSQACSRKVWLLEIGAAVLNRRSSVSIDDDCQNPFKFSLLDTKCSSAQNMMPSDLNQEINDAETSFEK